MRYWHACVLFAFALLTSPQHSAALDLATTERAAVPAFEMQTLDGERVTLDAWAGKVVVLNFWATWCAPCKEEMPSLDSLAASFDGRPLAVLAVAMDQTPANRLESFMDALGIEHLTTLHDPALTALRTFGLRGLPSTLVLDAEGREVGRHEGLEIWDRKEVVAALEPLVEEAEADR